jgi:uncharacterized membrane protein
MSTSPVSSVLTLIHLALILPCIVLGAYLLLATKGNAIHKCLGRIYMALMFSTAILTLFIPAQVGQMLWNHFGVLHLLSFLTLYTVPIAIYAARSGDIKRHRRAMWILYVGGILIAGSFAILGEGRFLNGVVFG